MSVAILVPMLGRAHRIVPLVESIERSTTVDHETLLILSPSDLEVREKAAELGVNFVVMDADYPRGDYARKINYGASITSTDWVFTGADDLEFHPGWFESCMAARRATTGFIGTNDLGSQRVMDGKHSTHSLVARWYVELGTIDEPGKIYHEGYWHEYCDDEAVQTARSRGMFRSARGAHVEHLHYVWGKAPNDALYARARERMAVGKRLYDERKHLWNA
ncbi:MAG: glycosyltransferase family 2 protein [Ilumatobacteraceae bacterium]